MARRLHQVLPEAKKAAGRRRTLARHSLLCGMRDAYSPKQGPGRRFSKAGNLDVSMPSKTPPFGPSPEALAAIFDAQAAPVVVADRDYRIVFTNQALLDLLGYERGELVGRHVDDIVPDQLRARYQKLRELNGSPTNDTLRGERVVLTKAGRELPVSLTVTTVRVGDEAYRVGSITDLSRQKAAEQETIERLYSVVEHSEVGVSVVQVGEDGAFAFESINPVVERLTGLQGEHVRGRALDQLFTAPGAEHLAAQYRLAIEVGSPLHYEQSAQIAQGRRSLRVTLVPIRNAEGRVHRIIGLSHDITDQRQAETALAQAKKSLSESEEKFAKAFAASPHPIGITDLGTGELLEVNDSFERVFGYTRTEALGKTTLELAIWDAHQRTRMLELLRERTSFRELEVAGWDRHGHNLSLVLSGEVIDLDGRPCLVTYVNDVTEREAAKQKLVESEALFAKAFRASPDALVVLDGKTGRFLEVNEGFERLFGRPRAEVLGKTSLELDLWENQLEREHGRTILYEERTLRDFPIVARTASGNLRNCLLSAEHIELASGRSVVAIVRDVTEKLRTERAKSELEAQLRQTQKMEALGTLAGGIAHDFNNILGAIMAYSELIKLDIHLPQQIESYLLELRRAGERAKDLVQQILTFSRRQPQQRRPVRLEHALREALNLLRSTLPATIQIQVRLSGDAPLVLADPTLIHQVLTNLGTNAAHAMRNAPGKLAIELDDATLDDVMAREHSELLPGRYARLTVRDSGEGMDADTLKRVFEPFFTTKAPGEGTGLGLAVVHGIVRDHEGAIFVDSAPGEGTTVTVYLPEHTVGVEAASEPPPELVRAHGERVLFIDDEAVLCRSVSALLERLGYRVTARSDPAEALELFRQKPREFDVVLTDLTMPGMTGVDVAREILKLSPGKPVLMMSGYSSTWTAESLKTLGVLDLIVKPLAAARLSQSLAAALGKKNTHARTGAAT
jgi:PAS domain S-box-containing protein